MGIFDSLAGLVVDVATIATKPVEIALDVTDAVVKPLADGLEVLTDEVKGLTK